MRKLKITLRSNYISVEKINNEGEPIKQTFYPQISSSVNKFWRLADNREIAETMEKSLNEIETERQDTLKTQKAEYDAKISKLETEYQRATGDKDKQKEIKAKEDEVTLAYNKEVETTNERLDADMKKVKAEANDEYNNLPLIEDGYILKHQNNSLKVTLQEISDNNVIDGEGEAFDKESLLDFLLDHTSKNPNTK